MNLWMMSKAHGEGRYLMSGPADSAVCPQHPSPLLPLVTEPLNSAGLMDTQQKICAFLLPVLLDVAM